MLAIMLIMVAFNIDNARPLIGLSFNVTPSIIVQRIHIRLARRPYVRSDMIIKNFSPTLLNHV